MSAVEICSNPVLSYINIIFCLLKPGSLSCCDKSEGFHTHFDDHRSQLLIGLGYWFAWVFIHKDRLFNRSTWMIRYFDYVKGSQAVLEMFNTSLCVVPQPRGNRTDRDHKWFGSLLKEASPLKKVSGATDVLFIQCTADYHRVACRADGETGKLIQPRTRVDEHEVITGLNGITQSVEQIAWSLEARGRDAKPKRTAHPVRLLVIGEESAEREPIQSLEVVLVVALRRIPRCQRGRHEMKTTFMPSG
jgi:hypothetical protein